MAKPPAKQAAAIERLAATELAKLRAVAKPSAKQAAAIERLAATEKANEQAIEEANQKKVIGTTPLMYSNVLLHLYASPCEAAPKRHFQLRSTQVPTLCITKRLEDWRNDCWTRTVQKSFPVSLVR